MLKFLRGLFGGLARMFGGLLDGAYRGIMLHLGHDLAQEAADAAEAEATRAERQAEAARQEGRHAEQLNATLLLLEAVRSGLTPASSIPEVARIVDPEAARAEHAQARAARAQTSRQAIMALVPPRPERMPREEMVVKSGWPTIVDPEDGAAASVGHYPA